MHGVVHSLTAINLKMSSSFQSVRKIICTTLSYHRFNTDSAISSKLPNHIPIALILLYRIRRRRVRRAQRACPGWLHPNWLFQRWLRKLFAEATHCLLLNLPKTLTATSDRKTLDIPRLPQF